MGVLPIAVRRSPGALLRPAAAARLAAASLKVARRRNSQLGIALVWHGISPSPREPHAAVVREHSTTVFREQLGVLRRLFSVVPASNLIEASASRREGEPFPVAITFDDDLNSHVELAAPLLREAGLPATFFVCGRAIESPHRFWWERLQDAVDRGLLTDAGLRAQLFGADVGANAEGGSLARAAESLPPDRRSVMHDRLGSLLGPDPVGSGLNAKQLRRLRDLGFELGFHIKDHQRLTELADSDLELALLDGRDRIDQITEDRLSLLAYPFGAADSRVARAAGRAGFSRAFTGVPKPITPLDERLLLGRFVPSFRSGGHLALQLGIALWRSSRRSEWG